MKATNALSIFLLFALQSFAHSQNTAQAPNVAPQPLASTDLIEAMSFVRSVSILGLQETYTVEGDRIFVGQTLAANTIIFTPGSRLIFTGERSPRYIIARTVKLPSEGSPGTITWSPYASPTTESSALQIPPQDSRASAGSIGGGEGAPGTSGADGHSGNPGYPGLAAPTVYLFTGTITEGKLTVILKGLDGGQGGKGQDGGDGGPGRTGSQGVSSIIDCKVGGGNGGNGGNGGSGGKGGQGGRGGDGGTFVFLSSSQAVLNPLAADGGPFEVDVPGGKGGPGGPGGDSGAGGPAGGGGSGSAFCQGGSPGKPGNHGLAGPVGDAGRDGVIGSFWVTALTSEQLKSLGVDK